MYKKGVSRSGNALRLAVHLKKYAIFFVTSYSFLIDHRGDGDCDYDGHCRRGLKCGNSNCDLKYTEMVDGGTSIFTFTLTAFKEMIYFAVLRKFDSSDDCCYNATKTT